MQRLVIYEDMEGAETALRKLNNTELDNRKIFLRKVGIGLCTVMSFFSGDLVWWWQMDKPIGG